VEAMVCNPGFSEPKNPGNYLAIFQAPKPGFVATGNSGFHGWKMIS